MDGDDIEPRVERLLGALDLDDKARLTAGADLWHTPAVERAGVPSVKVTDGPAGARGASLTGTTSASFPCGTALGATWDPGLVREVGVALGEEARSKGAHVLLAPTVNLHRHPLAGRNFECVSEDPFLTARHAVAYVEGLQSTGVGACVKHLVANDSEFERMTMSSEVPERALRELYLAPFEAAVREAGAWSVMSAYNRLGGTWCSEHPWLLRTVLVDEWGFDGLVISDWFGTHSAVESAEAGLGLEMPGPAAFRGAALADAVRAGRLAEAVLDDLVRRFLRLAVRTGAVDDGGSRDPGGGPSGAERSVDEPEHRRLARRAAIEATVLLRNEGGVLPLDPATLRSVAVVGPNAEIAQVQGGGSARVNPHDPVSPLRGLRERLGDSVEVHHERGCVIAKRCRPVDGLRLAAPASVEYRDGPTGAGETFASETTSRLHWVWLGGRPDASDPGAFAMRAHATVEFDEDGPWTFGLTASGTARVLLDGEEILACGPDDPRGDAFYGLGSEELRVAVPVRAGVRHELAVEWDATGMVALGGVSVGCMPPERDDLLDRAVAAAAAADAAIVVVGTDDEWESEGHDRASIDLPGDQDELVRRVAAANPRTVVVLNAGSPVRCDWAGAVPAILAVWFPGQELGHALAAVLCGDADPGGRLPTTFPVRIEDTPAYTNYPGDAGRVHYGEGVFVGYRWYDARDVEPRFCFGHGLSYTTFSWGDATISTPVVAVDALEAGAQVTVTVPVTNTGDRAGTEVVQCYVAGPAGSELARPPRELRAFAKVHLGPGETRSVVLRLGARGFAAWHPGVGDWWIEPGTYGIVLGASSRDRRAHGECTVVAPG